MNIIVIDDLIHVTKGIIKGVNWKKLNVLNVYEANNIIDAKKIISETTIHVMVCDIEMPMGNGLELLEWVREVSPRTQCIFLTSHGEFEYAKLAIKLGSFDYLLQPIKYEELEIVIGKAIEKVRADSKINEYYDYGIFWEKNHDRLIEKFWYDLVTGLYKDNCEKIKKAATTVNIDKEQREPICLVLINIMRREVLLADWEDELLLYALKNILEEIMHIEDNRLVMLKINSSQFVVIIDKRIELLENQLIQMFEHFVSASFRDIKVSVSCYIGEKVSAESLHKALLQLQVISDNNVAYNRKVVKANTIQDLIQKNITIPHLKDWEKLLENGENELLLVKVKFFLEELVKDETLNAHTLFEFHQEFIKMYYRVVESKQFDTHQLFREKNNSELYVKSLNSVYDMIVFIEYILTYKFDAEHVNGYYESSIEKIKEYIQNNLEKDLMRNELAEIVFLNPEYLSRLFKKKNNMSLSTFIANERVKVAKELLSKTNLSVSIIASKVGYASFSHFSQIFKKYEGITPLEFRQKDR